MVEREEAAVVEAWLSALETRQMADLIVSKCRGRCVRCRRPMSSDAPRWRKAARCRGWQASSLRALLCAASLLAREPDRARARASVHGGQLDSRPWMRHGCSRCWLARACSRKARVTGVDRHPWAVEEARRTLSVLGVTGTARRRPDARADCRHGVRGAAAEAALLHRRATGGGRPHQPSRPGRAAGVRRERDRRCGAARRLARSARPYAASGGRVLIVEPLAGFVAPWWGAWQRAFEASGGRAHEWRFDVKLPAIVEKLDRAAGLNHRELKARTLSF